MRECMCDTLCSACICLYVYVSDSVSDFVSLLLPFFFCLFCFCFLFVLFSCQSVVIKKIFISMQMLFDSKILAQVLNTPAHAFTVALKTKAINLKKSLLSRIAPILFHSFMYRYIHSTVQVQDWSLFTQFLGLHTHSHVCAHTLLSYYG